MDREDRIKAREAKKYSEFVEDFFKKHIGDDERAVIKRLVMKAAADGKFEAMVYSFEFFAPTADGNQQRTVRVAEYAAGRAKEVLDLFDSVARPQGYTLKAMVINFPEGMPGDIGFFLGWEPPVK